MTNQPLFRTLLFTSTKESTRGLLLLTFFATVSTVSIGYLMLNDEQLRP